MSAFLAHPIPLSALVTFLLVFGFAPRAVLRLTLLAYRRNDVRRKELLAELSYIPWWDRPRWVAEQIEVAVSEGLRGRLTRLLKREVPEPGRLSMRIPAITRFGDTMTIRNEGCGQLTIILDDGHVRLPLANGKTLDVPASAFWGWEWDHMNVSWKAAQALSAHRPLQVPD